MYQCFHFLKVFISFWSKTIYLEVSQLWTLTPFKKKLITILFKELIKWNILYQFKSYSPNEMMYLSAYGSSTKQWAAVRTNWGWIKVPPQWCGIIKPCILICACHGHWPLAAVSPFTTREDAVSPHESRFQ